MKKLFQYFLRVDENRLILLNSYEIVNTRQKKWERSDIRNSYSNILPSVEMVTTCHGINFPLA